MIWFFYGATLFLLGRITIAIINFWAFPKLSCAGGGVSPLSLLVPIRDEAVNLPTLIPGLLAQGADEILLLDDGSSDGSAELARNLAAGSPNLEVIAGAPLPAGWCGKSWACYQLAQRARNELLVFVDADVRLAAGALAAVQKQMAAEQADLLSVFPAQVRGSWAERIILPLIEVVLLTGLAYPLLKLPIARAVSANGQFLAFRRQAYLKIGTHEAVRDRIIEDLALAYRAKAQGLRVALALGGECIQVRMYRNYGQIRAGLGKNLLAAHAGSRWLLAASWLFHCLVYTVPWFLSFWQPYFLILAGLGVGERMIVNLKTGGPLWEGILVPWAPIWALPIYWQAALVPPRWKGRVYP